MNPTNEYGYVLIDTPEKKKAMAPKVSTDELWSLSSDSWIHHTRTGDFCESSSNIYRRKIDVGEGWELVPPNELLQCEQESTNDGAYWVRHTWPKTHPTALTAMNVCNDGCKHPLVLAFRRRKQPSSEWNDVSVCIPPIGSLVWVNHSKLGVILRTYTGTPNKWTHWRPVKPGEIPEPPAIPKSQEVLDDEAAEKWIDGNISESYQGSLRLAMRTAFIAGLKAGRAK